MSNKITFQELVDRTAALQAVFQKNEKRPWTIDTYVMELLAEAGTLADSIVIKEGYRTVRPGQDIDLEDDICDVIFILLLIANHYGIDLEQAYLSMIDATREKLKHRSNG